MTTLKQFNANRKNSLRSTGPKTEAGKRVCSHNAYKHGLASRLFIVNGEDPEQLDQLIHEMIDTYNATAGDECLILERIAHSLLMGQRGRGMMQEFFYVAQRGPLRFIDFVPLIQRYIRDTERSVEKAYELFFRIRAERRKEAAFQATQLLQSKPLILEIGSVPDKKYFPDLPQRSRPIPPLKKPKRGSYQPTNA